MRRPTSCICTRCAPGSMGYWRAKDASIWPAPRSTSCRHASYLTSKGGRSKTSSHIDGPGTGRLARTRHRMPRDNPSGARLEPNDTVFLMDDAGASLSAVTPKGRQELPLAHDLAVGRRVIRAEIEGLRQLAEALDGAFGTALDLCSGASGR